MDTVSRAETTRARDHQGIRRSCIVWLGKRRPEGVVVTVPSCSKRGLEGIPSERVRSKDTVSVGKFQSDIRKTVVRHPTGHPWGGPERWREISIHGEVPHQAGQGPGHPLGLGHHLVWAGGWIRDAQKCPSRLNDPVIW